jgi:hypothetical protein
MTKRKAPARAKRPNRGRMPWGYGSMQMRGASWWLIYRDADGKVVQENAQTAEEWVARLKLGQRAITTAEARLDAVCAVVNEEIAKVRAARGDDPAAGETGPDADSDVRAETARAGRTNPRKRSSRSTRKGTAQ